ncbi:MAG TPA: tetratricopeptide repeat protein, partial [Candidatus Angelobacter sp.]
MNRPSIFVRIVLALLALVSTQIFAQETSQQTSQPTHDQQISLIEAQSQEALGQHDEQKALTFIKDGLIQFPNDESLQIQLARIYVEQKRDQQAIGLLNAILLANPANRNAKLELALIYGYRGNYRQSDRL